MVATTRKQAAAAEEEAVSPSSSSSGSAAPRTASQSPVESKSQVATLSISEAKTPSPAHSVSPQPEMDGDGRSATEPQPLAKVPTIPLYDFDLPLELDTPYGSCISAFNPASYDKLKSRLAQWFPALMNSQTDSHDDGSQQAQVSSSDASLDSNPARKRSVPLADDARSSSPSKKKPASAKQSKRKGKGKVKKADYIQLEVEFVPMSLTDEDLQLPRTSKGFAGNVFPKPHHALAVVALAPPDYVPQAPERKKAAIPKVKQKAQGDQNAFMPEDEEHGQDDPETLLLGYIIPSVFKDNAHPLAHLDPSLLSKEWIQLYGEVTLVAPFLPPESEVFGPNAFEAAHKRGSMANNPSSKDTKSEAAAYWAAPFDDNHKRPIMEGTHVPSTRLLGVLSVQVGLEPAALQYGVGDDNVDGFVASNADVKNTAAEGSLGLARALRQVIPSIVDWQHSFIELDTDAHTYWDRNESFYDLPPKQTTLARHLVLDKVESVDLPAASPSKSPSKKRKKSSTTSRSSRGSRNSLLTLPPLIDDDEHDAGNRSVFCRYCGVRHGSYDSPAAAAQPAEPSRPKLDALPLGEQISSTDPRLGEVSNPKFLPLDLNIASLLEACRPPSDGPQVYPPTDVIPTQLLGYQARCLAWMIKRETVVDEDVDQLLPNWFPLRCKPADHIMQRRLQLEAEREAILDAMQRGLSLSRRRANVKAAQIAAAAKMSNGATSEFIGAANPLKREPFIDPVEQVIYFDQVSGLLSLRRFLCRPSEPGGALCESMGLGKTLESLSLIAAHPRPDNTDLLAYDTSRSARMIASMDPSQRPFVSRATLVVCPAALIEQWMDEIRKHFRSRITFDMDTSDDAAISNQQPGVVRYRHADFAWDVRSRRDDVRALAQERLVQPDIVVATYEELAFQLAESHRVPQSDNQVRTPLLEVLFWRILLDEAQVVAGASGKATNMVHELWRSNCWMVTGTPVTKGIGDIQGIFAFMDHDPFAAPRFFREILQQPFSKGCVEGIRRLRAILPRFVWRHTQAHVEDEIVLPPCKSEVLEIRLKHVERLFYDKEVGKYRQTYAKKAAQGVATVAQPSFLVHLRQLLSHPQVADEFMHSHKYSRLSFAELFRLFFKTAESELDTIRMQVVTSTLQLVWGHDFREAEKDKRHWRGGPSPLELKPEEIRRLLEAALRTVTMALEDQARAKAMTLSELMQQDTEPNAEEQAAESADQSADGLDAVGDVDVDAKDSAGDGLEAAPSTSASSADAYAQKGPGPADTGARTNLTWEEAHYWLRTLLQKHADPATVAGANEAIELPTRWDPERPMRTCFEKEFRNATDPTVDLNDARFHLVVQDAGADDMDEKEYLAQIAAEQSSERAGDDAPRKKVKMDAAFEPGLLKKSRLRGKASQRQTARVWLYKPKERLSTTHARLLQHQDKLPSKEHEVAFLREQTLEGLACGTNVNAGQGTGTSSAVGDGAAAPEALGPECRICYEPKLQIGVLPCYHSFCVDCIDTICGAKTRPWDLPRCPQCRLVFSLDKVTRIMERGRSASADGTEEVQGDWSGKISGLILDIKKRLSQDPTHKAVVFSHWPKMLAFVREALAQNGVEAVVFGGDESKQAEALRAIRDDDHVNAILVPFRASAGAAGLTLTSCDLAYLMEPALDAALEAQAVGRIHRIGQRRETTILRVRMKDTIEDAVMRIADERSRRGMALAAHVDAVAATTDATSAAQSSAPSSSRTTATSDQAHLSTQMNIKSEAPEATPLASLVPSPSTSRPLTPSLRERSIKSSVAASVGIGRESDNTSLTMVEVGLILGFDVEEEKRKARQRRESLLERAGLTHVTVNLTDRDLDELEEDLAMDEDEEDDFGVPWDPMSPMDADDFDEMDRPHMGFDDDGEPIYDM